MTSDKLIRLAEETGKKTSELGRALRHEKQIARSDARKKAVDDFLKVAEDCDAALAAGLRAFEDAVFK